MDPKCVWIGHSLMKNLGVSRLHGSILDSNVTFGLHFLTLEKKFHVSITLMLFEHMIIHVHVVEGCNAVFLYSFVQLDHNSVHVLLVTLSVFTEVSHELKISIRFKIRNGD